MNIIEKVDENEWRFIEPPCVRELQEEFNETLDYYYDGKYQLVKEMLRSIVERCEYHIDAIHHLAIIADIEGKEVEFYLLEKKAVDIALKNITDEFMFGEDILEWGWLENRPFLRAYHGLGLAYFRREEFQKALNIFNNLLSFTPNDNQGVRCLAVDCYFYLNQPHNVIAICDQYLDDTSCELLYGKPLALFQLDRIKEAQKALKEAISVLPLIAKELLKKSHIKPKSIFEGAVSHGGKDEAFEYWEMSGKFWVNTPGALDLLKENA